MFTPCLSYFYVCWWLGVDCTLHSLPNSFILVSFISLVRILWLLACILLLFTRFVCIFLFSLFVCSFYSHTCGTWKFPGLGLNQSCNWSLYHSHSNTGSLTKGDQGSNPHPHGHSVRFLTYWAMTATPVYFGLILLKCELLENVHGSFLSHFCVSSAAMRAQLMTVDCVYYKTRMWIFFFPLDTEKEKNSLGLAKSSGRVMRGKIKVVMRTWHSKRWSRAHFHQDESGNKKLVLGLEREVLRSEAGDFRQINTTGTKVAISIWLWNTVGSSGTKCSQRLLPFDSPLRTLEQNHVISLSKLPSFNSLTIDIKVCFCGKRSCGFCDAVPEGQVYSAQGLTPSPWFSPGRHALPPLRATAPPRPPEPRMKPLGSFSPVWSARSHLLSFVTALAHLLVCLALIIYNS